jgi:cell wall-associated NlpC family hydrolase
LTLATAGPVGAGDTATDYQRVYKVAKAQIGDPWKHYAKGPHKFDCVGFVWFVFAENGLKDRIGGYRGVKSYYNWFKSRGLVSKSNPKVGDLVVWGRFKHIGMYIGDGKAISALINPYGVKIHKVKGYLNVGFKAYLHVKIQR